MKVARHQSHPGTDDIRTYQTLVLIPEQAETDWETLEDEPLKAGWLKTVGLQQLRTGACNFSFTLESGPDSIPKNAAVKVVVSDRPRLGREDWQRSARVPVSVEHLSPCLPFFLEGE